MKKTIPAYTQEAQRRLSCELEAVEEAMSVDSVNEVRIACALGIEYGLGVAARLLLETGAVQIDHPTIGTTIAAVSLGGIISMGAAIVSREDFASGKDSVAIGRAIALLRAFDGKVPDFLLGKG